MTIYAVVKDGDVLGFRSQAPNVDQSTLAEGKPRILPVEREEDAFNPASEVLDGPTYEVEASRVVERFTARAKNSDEIAAMKAAKDAAIEAEFHRLYNLPITYSVGEAEYIFHANEQARENITGVLMAYREAADLSIPLPDPRTWVPMDSGPISITRAQLAGLGIAIAARKDILFGIKKAKQVAVAALTDPVAIDAVDPLAGWDIA